MATSLIRVHDSKPMAEIVPRLKKYRLTELTYCSQILEARHASRQLNRLRHAVVEEKPKNERALLLFSYSLCPEADKKKPHLPKASRKNIDGVRLRSHYHTDSGIIIWTMGGLRLVFDTLRRCIAAKLRWIEQAYGIHVEPPQWADTPL